MSAKLVLEFINAKDKIRPAARMVLIMLANYANDKRTVKMPMSALAKALNISESVCKKHLAELIKHKLVREIHA
jgi:DNA-binding IscR family transcriptional regulator